MIAMKFLDYRPCNRCKINRKKIGREEKRAEDARHTPKECAIREKGVSCT